MHVSADSATAGRCYPRPRVGRCRAVGSVCANFCACHCAEILQCTSRCPPSLRLQFVDQDMAEPSDTRMQDIVRQLKTIQRDEKPPGFSKEWVACDDCEKWRKVPRGFQFDRDKNFFCHMLPKMSCDIKEEPWGNENDNSFIDSDWVLFSWDRFTRELARERERFGAAMRLVESSKVNGTGTGASPHQQSPPNDQLSAMHHEQEGRRTSEEQSASTSTSAELPEQQAMECEGVGVHAPVATAYAATLEAAAEA